MELERLKSELRKNGYLKDAPITHNGRIIHHYEVLDVSFIQEKHLKLIELHKNECSFWGVHHVFDVYMKFQNEYWAARLLEHVLTSDFDDILTLLQSSAIQFYNFDIVNVLSSVQSLQGSLGPDQNIHTTLRLSAQLFLFAGKVGMKTIAHLKIWDSVYSDLRDKYQAKDFTSPKRIEDLDDWSRPSKANSQIPNTFINFIDIESFVSDFISNESNFYQRNEIHHKLENFDWVLDDLVMIFLLAFSPYSIREDGSYFMYNEFLQIEFEENTYFEDYLVNHNDFIQDSLEMGECPGCSAKPCQCSHPSWAD